MPGQRQRRGGRHRELVRGLVDVDPDPDHHQRRPGADPLHQDAADLAGQPDPAGSSTSTSLGHFSAADPPSARATAYPATSGTSGHHSVAHARVDDGGERQRRSGRASPTPGRGGRGRRSGGRRPRDGHGAGRRRRSRCWTRRRRAPPRSGCRGRFPPCGRSTRASSIVRCGARRSAISPECWRCRRCRCSPRRGPSSLRRPRRS